MYNVSSERNATEQRWMWPIFLQCRQKVYFKRLRRQLWVTGREKYELKWNMSWWKVHRPFGIISMQYSTIDVSHRTQLIIAFTHKVKSWWCTARLPTWNIHSLHFPFSISTLVLSRASVYPMCWFIFGSRTYLHTNTYII